MRNKLILLSVVSLLTISCSEQNFTTEGFDEFASSVECHDAECSTYTVRDNAKNPSLYKKTDILFVFDTSGSMKEENLKLAERMNGFVQDLESKSIDYNICHTLADKNFFEKGKVELWSNGESVLNRNTTSVADVFYNTTNIIKDYSGSGHEEPISATYHMIDSLKNEDCFRDNVPLEVVILSDEDELSCGNHCGTYTKNLYALQGVKLQHSNYPHHLVALAESTFRSKAFTVNAIVKQSGVSSCGVSSKSDGVFHKELALLTGGILGDICLSDYASQLSKISENISQTLSSVALKCDPTGEIQLRASNDMTFKQEIIKNRLQLTPGIPSGVDVELVYDCQL